MSADSPHPSASQSSQAGQSGNILVVALWFGLVAGLGEGLTNMVLQWTTNRLMGVWVEIIWIAPLFNLLLFGAMGLVLAGAARLWRWRQLPWLTLTVALCTLLTALNWLSLTLYSFIYTVVILLLVVGITVQVTRWFVGHQAKAISFWRRTLPWVAGLAVVAFVAIQGGQWLGERVALASLPETSGDPTNVLVIVVDALRGDHLSSYGYGQETTPNLDRLAAEGALFENAYSSASYTLPSHASLLTGLYPHQHGVQWEQPKTLFEGAYPTLGETLQTVGYRTAAFSGNTFWFSREEGFGRGFMRFDDFFASPADMALRTVYGRMFERFVMRRLGAQDIPARKRAPETNQALLDWIDQPSNAPFFAFVNYMDVHDPYLPPEPYRSRFSSQPDSGGLLNWRLDREDIELTPEQIESEIDAYDGALAFVDAQIGLLLDDLSARGLNEKLLVIVTSDHGDAFDEHGTFLHAKSLYREEIRVPLIVWQPGRVPADQRVTQPVTNAAIPATVLELIGQPDAASFQGPALASFWQQPTIPAEWTPPLAQMEQRPWASPNFPIHHGAIRSLVSLDWHFLEHEAFGVELYDLAGDPLESRDMAEDPALQPTLDQFHAALDSLFDADLSHAFQVR